MRPPNAAPAEYTEILKKWADDLGIKWEQVLADSDVGKTSAWRVEQGLASHATIAKIVDTLNNLETKRALQGPRRPRQVGNRIELIENWQQLGTRLMLDSVEGFNELLSALSDIVVARSVNERPRTMSGRILEAVLEGRQLERQRRAELIRRRELLMEGARNGDLGLLTGRLDPEDYMRRVDALLFRELHDAEDPPDVATVADAVPKSENES